MCYLASEKAVWSVFKTIIVSLLFFPKIVGVQLTTVRLILCNPSPFRDISSAPSTLGQISKSSFESAIDVCGLERENLSYQQV